MACQTVEEEITKNLWHTWNRLGTNINLSYVAVLNLIRHIVVVCRQNDIDIKSLDFNVMIDASLSSDENLTEIDKAFSMMGAYTEQQQFNKISGMNREHLKSVLEQHHTPVIEIPITQTTQIAPINIEPVHAEIDLFNPLTAPYSDQELKEITEYLKRRQHGKEVKPKFPRKTKPLSPQEQKLLTVSSKVARKTWGFIKWVLI
jgi:hypothetical protein